MNEDSAKILSDQAHSPHNIVKIAREYEAHGFILVPIDPATKRPVLRGWQRPENQGPIPDDWGGGIGIAHLGSHTCCLDLDMLKRAKDWMLLEHGVVLDAFLEAEDAVRIVSGRDDKDKLLYRLDEPLLRVVHAEEIDGKRATVLEFRCMSSKGTSFQDVLPPSIHPGTGEPYRWGGRGDWRSPPPLPEELKTVWLALIEARGSKDARDEAHAEPPPPRSGNWGAEVWREALTHTDPDCDYDTWIKVGMAAKAAGLSFEDWDEWSSKGAKYAGQEDTRTHWDSFEAQGGTTPGTLFHMAVESGWTPPPPPRPSVDEMFPLDMDFGDTIQQPRRSRDRNIVLAEAERRYVWVRVENKVADLQAPPSQNLMSIEALRNYLRPYRTVVLNEEGDEEKVPTSKLWESSPNRKEVDALGYHPGEQRIYELDGQRYLNQFHMPDHQKTTDEHHLDVFLDHIEYLFPNPEHRDFFLTYLASKVQRPEVRATVVPLHIALKHGTGRNWLAKVIERLFGPWNYASPKFEAVAGRGEQGPYQDYLHNTLWCVINEVRVNKDRYGIDAQVRDRLVDSPLHLNLKYGAAGTFPVFANFLMFSNHPDALILPREDRRVWVSRMDAEPRDAEYYRRLYGWLTPENVAALYWYLKRRSVPEGFATRNAPTTPEKLAMLEESETELEAALTELLDFWTAIGIQVVTMAMIREALMDDGLDFVTSGDEKQIAAVLRNHGAHRSKRTRLDDATNTFAWVLSPKITNADSRWLRQVYAETKTWLGV